MLYDINPTEFADHVRHAKNWCDLGFRCGLKKSKFGNGKLKNNDMIAVLRQKAQNMRLNTEHFNNQRFRIPDDVFRTMVVESTSLSRVMRKCKVDGGWWQQQILNKIEDLNIDTTHFKLRKPKTEYKLSNKVDAIDEETFKTLVKNNTTWINLALACGYQTSGGIRYTHKRIEMLGLDTSHFESRIFNDNDKIFVVGSKRLDSTCIKQRLLRDFGRSYECAACNNKNFTKCDGVLLWNEKEITLELEHKNGKNYDNRLENLEFLCPNCHSQTSTYKSKNSKKYKSGQAWLEEGKTSYAPGSIASLLN